MSTTTAGAQICYTKNGTTPVPNSTGTIISASNGTIPIAANQNITLQAVAFKAGYTTSSVATGYFDTTDPRGGGLGPVQQTAATVSPRSVSYTLEKMGNRTKVVDGGVATNYTPDVINRYSAVGAEAPGYGAAHQLTSYATNSYSYIGDTYLARVTRGANTYTLGYDALGRCVRRTFNNAITYYGYDGDRPIQENGATLASTVYGKGVDEPMIRFEAALFALFALSAGDGILLNRTVPPPASERCVVC